MAKRHLRSVLLFAACVMQSLVVVPIARALHAQSPPISQVTQQVEGTITATAAAGYDWTFVASGDSLGNGNATPELFLYEHEQRVLGGALGIAQLTCGGFAPRSPSMAQAGGGLVAFDADGRLCGDPRHNCLPPFDASSSHRQIFFYVPENGHIRQVTRCGGDCVNPNISGNGRMLVFESSGDVLGTNGGSPFPTTQVYQGDLRTLGPGCPFLPCSSGPVTSGLALLTHAGGRNARQSKTGKIVVFESDGDPLGTGLLGVPHVYALDVKKRTLQQLPPGNPAAARRPAIDQSGKKVAYEIDTVRGAPTPGTVTEVWFSKIRKNRAPLTMSLTPNATADSAGPSMSANGVRIAFSSGADLLNSQSIGTQLFVYGIKGSSYDRRNLVQVTAAVSGVSLVEQGTKDFAGFVSEGDFVGNGNSTEQFFVANLYRRASDRPPSPSLPSSTSRATQTPQPTATPVLGVPVAIGISLVADAAVDNGDNTLTTVVAAAVSDYFGNPVPDGTIVAFEVTPPLDGVLVENGTTNQDPSCDVTSFEQETGTTIANAPGVAHVCVRYPGARAGTTRQLRTYAGARRCIGGGSPGRTCSTEGDCEPRYVCSVHDAVVCDPSNGTADCPLGEACATEHPACESTAADAAMLVLPGPVNACAVNGDPCSDANPCTLGDVCAGGTSDRACAGGAREGLPCAVASDCPPDGATPSPDCVLTNPPICQPGMPVACPDDGDACTDDVCDVLTGQCWAPHVCLDDGNPCTDDVCDRTTGQCGLANVDPCSDGNPCTLGDVCDMGSCRSGSPMTCPDDGNRCTVDVCNPSTAQCGIRFDPCACSAP